VATEKQQIVDLYKSKTLLGTVGKPEDMAEAYLYLMRDAFDRHHTFVRWRICVGVSYQSR
jgi:hypothetical protein